MSTTFRGSPLALTVLALLHYKPLHPYGVQRLIREWGKDLVVNVGQRTSVYRTIDRLAGAGLVAVRETERDQAYPERTVYEVTDAGRMAAREWLTEMLAVPKKEYPEFPAAMANLLLLTAEEIPDLLERRLKQLQGSLQELESELAEQRARGLPRVSLLESEYLETVTSAEADWVRAVLADLRSGRLRWSAEDFAEYADPVAD
jgi:DNA-binding PadR family transcriptional regulator